MALAQLEPVPEDWSRALAVVAHPDDLEYGGAAVIARWSAQGKQVAYLVISRGEAGIDTMDPVEAATVRTAEQVESARVVGVSDVTFLDYPDGTITYGLDLRRDIASAIRRQQPELVVSVNHRDTFGGVFLNMADHRAVGQATIDGVRDAGNRWVFPELRDGGLEPWGGVRHLAVMASPHATHAVDVTETFDLGVESLRRHAAYLAGLGDPDPDQFLRERAEATAARFGGRLAVSFELLGV
jgi:LmbE family N-acetylglucosaminyl deacetylase